MKNNNSIIFPRLLKYRVLILIILAALVAAAVPGLLKLNITVSIDNFFLDDDPIAKKQAEFKKLFGNNDFIGVLFESDDVFSRDSLERIRLIGTALQENVPFAGEITSIASDSNMVPGRDRLRFDNGILQNDDNELARIREIFKGVPTISERLISADMKQSWILLSLENYPGDEEWHGELDPQFTAGKAAWETVQSLDADGSRLTATGVPVYAYRQEIEMVNDLMRILVIGFIAALVISVIIIRNIQGVLGAILVIGTTTAVVFGIQGHLGIAINSALMAVPILLSTGVSIGYTVHISRFFILSFRNSGIRHNSVLYALEQSAKPILFTAFTTIAALLSFVFVQIKPIRWVGLTSAACILAVFFLTMLMFPVILSIGQSRKPKVTLPEKLDWLDPLLKRFAHIVNRFPLIILAAGAVLIIVSAVGLSRLEVDFDAEKMMGSRLQHMEDQLHIGASEIAISDSLDLVIKFQPDGLKDPETLAGIAKLQTEILKLQPVQRATSLNSILSSFNYLTHGYNPDYETVPETAPQLRGLLMYFSRLAPGNLLSWCSEDYSTTRLLIELSNFSSREIEEVIDRVHELSEELNPEALEIYFSGSTYQMAIMNQYVTRGLVKSIVISLVTISALMIIVFRSFRIGLAAMIPNIFPVIIAGAMMGFLGIPLEFVTMTIAPMIMGLAVDDTIHLVFHIKKAMLQSNDFSSVITATFKTVGSAITETTIILCLTFLVFTTSRINSIINMGIISFTGMLAAYLSDIFITPVVIRGLLRSGLPGGRLSG